MHKSWELPNRYQHLFSAAASSSSPSHPLCSGEMARGHEPAVNINSSPALCVFPAVPQALLTALWSLQCFGSGETPPTGWICCWALQSAQSRSLFPSQEGVKITPPHPLVSSGSFPVAHVGCEEFSGGSQVMLSAWHCPGGQH